MTLSRSSAIAEYFLERRPKVVCLLLSAPVSGILTVLCVNVDLLKASMRNVCWLYIESELTREGQHGVYIYYTLSTAATDAVSFSSVPIRNVRSVFLSAEAKSTWSSRIKGLLACASLVSSLHVQPLFKFEELMLVFRQCFHGDETTRWSFDQPSQTVREHRVVLNIGAVLPPFGKAVAIDVHLESSFSIRTATAFVAKLQPYVPEFNWNIDTCHWFGLSMCVYDQALYNVDSDDPFWTFCNSRWATTVQKQLTWRLVFAWAGWLMVVSPWYQRRISCLWR